MKSFWRVVCLKISHRDKKMSGNLYNTTRGALICCRVMGLLPLAGLINKSSDKLRYTLWSSYTIYFTFSLFGQVIMLLATLNHLYQKGISLGNFTTMIFHASSLISLLVLIYTGQRYPLLMKNIRKLEGQLPPFRKKFGITVTIWTVLIMILATVEFILFTIYAITAVYPCGSNNVAENYFKFLLPCIFDYTSFAIWKGVMTQIFTLQASFIWSYNDLFIILISIYLNEYFLIHNARLKKALQQEKFLCVKFRTEYLKIAHLVKLVNVRFATSLMTAIAVNLHWISTQLIYALNKGQTRHIITCKYQDTANSNAQYGVKPSTYFTFSFSYLVIRTFLELILAARVHSNALVPVYLLYDLPRSKFSIEVQRYISQIKTIKVAINGMDFFRVTRGTMLTVFGTIVTYELVLFQFN